MKWDSSRYGRLIRSACVAFTLAYVLSRKWDVAIAALLVVGFGTFLTWKPVSIGAEDEHSSAFRPACR